MNKKKELKENRRRRLADAKRIDELYCAKQRIKSLESFDDFKNLRFLWLNGNKLCHLGMSLQSNTLLVELYLHDNNIYSVTGCLQHLKVLQLLLLHNNFIADLPTVLHEFRNMYRLETLNLFDNPVAFEPNYQIRVISSLPSLKIFDRNEVTTLRERAKWLKKSRAQVLTDSAVFKQQAKTKRIHKCNKSLYDLDHRCSCDKEKEEEKNEGKREDKSRKVNDSILVYNNLNWKRIPFSKEKRTMKGKFKAEIISYLYQ